MTEDSSVNKRDYSRFYTPKKIAEQMVFMARPIRSTQIWLEPSAGDGSLVRAVKDVDDRIKVHAVEENQSCKLSLINSGASAVFIGDFLQYNPDFQYDRIIANPPFGNGIDLGAHFMKMYSLLKIDGIMVILLPMDYIRPMEIIHNVKLLECEAIENWATNKDGTVTPIIITKYKKLK
jgi:hypothetical protein